MLTTTAPPEYWNSLYANQPLVYRESRVQFKEIFARFLPTGGRCLEIGCYPGDYLLYLCKTFSYEANGIDTAPGVATELSEHFRCNGVKVGHFGQADFNEFAPAQLYDIVCSFGFIEHFHNFREVIRRHTKLVAPGGTLVISAPNFRYIQFVLHRIFDSENLSRHVLPAMDLSIWKEELLRCGMDVIFSSYYRTFDFWVESADRSRLTLWLLGQLNRYAYWPDAHLDWPNRFTSPYFICIARRPE